MLDEFKIVNLTPGSGGGVASPQSPGGSMMGGEYSDDDGGSSYDVVGGSADEAVEFLHGGPTYAGVGSARQSSTGGSELDDAQSVPNPMSTADPAPTTAIVGDESSDRDDDATSDAGTMSTASLIANGCMYTILEQMLMTPGGDDDASEKVNVASLLKRIAVALEGIAERMPAQQQEQQSGGRK